MIEFAQAIPFSFAALFPVLNPFAGALIFLNLTKDLSDQDTNKLAFQVAFNTFVLLVAVLLTGSYILNFFGITVHIVQVGGGLLLAYIGWKILNQSYSDGSTAVTTKRNPSEIAFFPLTMPITAGPGCIAVTLTLAAHESERKNFLLGGAGTIVGIFLVALSVFIFYRYAKKVTKSFGQSGSEVIMRLAAFINLCLGLQIMWFGLKALIHQL